MTVAQLIPHILACLPGRYGATKDALLPRMSTLSLEELFNILEAKELSLKTEFDLHKEQKGGNQKRSHPQAAPVVKQQHRRILAVGSGEGSGTQHMPGGNRPYRDISKVECYKCGKLGHYANKCKSNINKTQNGGVHKKTPYPGNRGGNRQGGNKPKKVRFAPRHQVHNTEAHLPEMFDKMEIDHPPPPPQHPHHSAPRSAMRHTHDD